MSTALYKMVKADPSLRLQVDQETGQTVLRGMGELHLEVTIDRMRTELGVEANMGRPQASASAKRSAAPSSTSITHKKQTGGSGQFAEVKMIFEPLAGGYRRRVLRRGRRRAHPARIHPVRRARDPHRVQERPGRRLRSRRFQSAPARRQVPRRRQLGARVRNRRPRVLPRIAQGEQARSCSSRSCASRW